MAEPNLHDKNLLFFATACPPIAEIVRVRETELTRAVFDESGCAIDIAINDSRLYNGAAAQFASDQVNAYMAKPSRIVVEAPNLDDLHDACSRAMATRLTAAAADGLAQPPRERAGILFVVGIGLGLHIPELIRRTRPRHVVLIEPIGEFLYHSMSALDWQPVWTQCTDAGITIDVIAGGDLAAIQQQLEVLLARFGEVAIDGSYIYIHYQNDMTRAVAAKCHELAGMTAILKGYYADEKLMVENTIANVVAHDFWLIEGELRPPIGAPAFIVGAGPSLDATLDIIAKWQDRAVIISAGSTLQALLHAGIVPDFHVEKENTQPTVDRLRHIRERSRERLGSETFGPVRLVASTTVKPGVTDLFDEKFLFLRSALSSTEMFGAGHRAVDGTSPYSANAALTLAAIMGFREIYLFGCDCGAKDASRHHSGETAYYTLDDYPRRDVEFPLRAPANFGGDVLTNAYFAWSRWTYEQVIAAAGLTVRNCSDGAMIAGAAPLPPDELTLADAPLDKTAVVETVKTASAHYTPGAYLVDQSVPRVTACWHEFAAAFRSHLDATLDGADDLFRFDRALRTFLDDAAETYGGVTTMVSGSARSMVPLAGYFLNRAPDADAQACLMDVFRSTYRAEVERILDDGSDLMAGLGTAPAAALTETG